MDINLEYYKIFYYVARFGSVTKAAKELCLSQPAVSQGLKQLEKALGVTVFVRKSKGVELTQEGKILYTYVSEGYEKILQGENHIKELINLEKGEIRIGASDMTLRFYLLPHLEKYHELYPDIKVNVTNAPTPDTVKHLLAGRIDFGIVTTPLEVPEHIEIIKVRQIQDIFIAGSQCKMLKNRILEYKNLLDYQAVCLEKNTSSRRYVDEELLKDGIELDIEFELATSDMVVQFVAKNFGIGCVVEDFAKEEIEKGTVYKINLKNEIPPRDMCIIYDNRVPISKAATSLLKLINVPNVI